MKKIHLFSFTALLLLILSCENPKPKFKTGDDPTHRFFNDPN